MLNWKAKSINSSLSHCWLPNQKWKLKTMNRYWRPVLNLRQMNWTPNIDWCQEGAERQEHAEKFIQVSHRRHQECIGSIQTAMEWEMTPFTFIVTWRQVMAYYTIVQWKLFLIVRYFCFEGSTSIAHDSESPINVGHCAEPGCYSRTINYNASNKQMKALIELSAECHQSVVVSQDFYCALSLFLPVFILIAQYECHYAPFEFNNVPFAWWNDRNGNPQYFWTGSFEKGIHACQCSIDGNCVDASVLCNCDATAPTPLADQGNFICVVLMIVYFDESTFFNFFTRTIFNATNCPQVL